MIGSTTRIASSAPASARSCRARRSVGAALAAAHRARGRSLRRGVDRDEHAGAAIDAAGSRPAPAASRVIWALSGREALGRVAEVVEPRVPAVGVGEGGRELPRAAECRPSAAPARRRREQHGVVDRCQAPLARDVLAGEQAADDLEALDEAAARWSNGSPKARNSVSFQPEPTPSTKRPPLISSIAAAMRAI